MATHKFVIPGHDPQQSAAMDEATHTFGENGGYQATEHLARKVFLNGPEWYFGGGVGSPVGPCPIPEQTRVAMRSELCPQCDSASMTIKADGRRTCRRCRHEWRKQ